MPRLDFLGKGIVQGSHISVPYHEIVPDVGRSVGSADLDGNLLIEGDNLLALKALLPMYQSRVKCIYIDPPYNTGNEGWCYNDNLKSPMLEAWLHKVVSRDDLCRHDKWLCMMYPRLSLLKELLSEDGVIFISIDDNEVHHLRMMMNEIFGEDNFVAQLVWRRRKTQANLSKHVAPVHEYIIAFAKNYNSLSTSRVKLKEDYVKKMYNNPDNDPRGRWRTKPVASPANAPNKSYELDLRNGRKITAKWRCSQKTYDELLQDNMIVIPKDGEGMPQIKVFLSDNKGYLPNTWLDDAGTNEEASKDIETIFGSNDDFHYSKPITLIKYLLTIGTSKDDIILDSFAGSGTTGHAVLALNQADNGKRKFILVECEDYANRITAERLRRVIQGVPTAKEPTIAAGLGGTLTYATLGNPMDSEHLLTGKNLPSWANLARHVFWLATGKSYDVRTEPNADYFVGEQNGVRIHLIYQPNLNFLKSNDAILTHEQAQEWGAKALNNAIVFAAGIYANQQKVKQLNVTFCQLPWAINSRIN